MDALGLLLRAGLVFALLGVTLWVVRRVDVGGAADPADACPVQVLSTTRVRQGRQRLRRPDRRPSPTRSASTEHAVSLLVPTAVGEAAEPQPAPVDADDEPAAPPSFAAALQAQVSQLVTSRRRPDADRTPVS